MIKLLFLVCVSVVAAGRSPNANYIAKLATNGLGRYSNNILEDASLDVPGLITKYGYPSEIHNVTTEDGYILTVHRIPHGRDENNTPEPNKPVVYILHGLLSSSADFLILGPGNALGYVLAEAGFDVWIGNARGNFYSRQHQTLDPDNSGDQSYWRFSWDEIGNFDIAATVDYILELTRQKKLHFIGHSQGGTSFLVLNSLKPEYNEKFISFQGLAPAAFFTNNNHSMFNSLAPLESILEAAAFAMGMGEVFPDRDFVTTFVDRFCGEGSLLASVCGDGLSVITLSENFNQTMLPLIYGHVPAGASVRQISHYGQSIRFNAFRRYNFNIFTNLSVYGQRTPPDYDLSKVTVPTYLYYGLSDREVYYKDLFLLAERLGNTVDVRRMSRSSFNHYDFIWGSDVRTQLYDELVEKMKEAERNYL